MKWHSSSVWYKHTDINTHASNSHRLSVYLTVVANKHHPVSRINRRGAEITLLDTHFDQLLLFNSHMCRSAANTGGKEDAFLPLPAHDVITQGTDSSATERPGVALPHIHTVQYNINIWVINHGDVCFPVTLTHRNNLTLLTTLFF